MPEVGVYVPAELIEPFVPEGEPVEPGTADALTLEQLLVFSDARSPVIKVARARLGFAEAAIVDASIALPDNPVVGFGVGLRSSGGASGFDFEVSVEQQLEIAGERGLRADAAQRDHRTIEASINEVRWSVHVEVHRLFVDLLLAAERREQAQRFVAFSESLHRVANQKVQAGESSPLILLVAESDLAQTREVLIEATRFEAALRVRLAALIGWPDEKALRVRGDLPKVKEAPSVAVLLEKMSKHHPALRTRELAIAAARAHASLAERETWPKPTLGLSYSRESAPGPEPEADIGFLSVGVPVPLWRANDGERLRAQAELRMADSEREAIMNELRGELLQAALSLTASAERVSLYETAVVPRLEENLALLQRAFELGEIDVHQVSQMRRRLLEATEQYLSARIEYYETAAALEGLVGTELWPTQEDAP